MSFKSRQGVIILKHGEAETLKSPQGHGHEQGPTLRAPESSGHMVKSEEPVMRGGPWCTVDGEHPGPGHL